MGEVKSAVVLGDGKKNLKEARTREKSVTNEKCQGKIQLFNGSVRTARVM
jgi:hypothetical protein